MTTEAPLLVVLQSAYQKGKLATSRHWRAWLAEFVTSRTARRLSELFDPSSPPLRYTNCTAVVTERIDEVPAGDDAHLRRQFRRHRPVLVVACGRLAERMCARLWAGDLLVVPHPASRLLTNRLLHAAAGAMKQRLTGRAADPEPWRRAFRQRRGAHAVETL